MAQRQWAARGIAAAFNPRRRHKARAGGKRPAARQPCGQGSRWLEVRHAHTGSLHSEATAAAKWRLLHLTFSFPTHGRAGSTLFFHRQPLRQPSRCGRRPFHSGSGAASPKTSRTNFTAPPPPLPSKRRVNSKQIKHLQHDSGPPHYKRARRPAGAIVSSARRGPTCQCGRRQRGAAARQFPASAAQGRSQDPRLPSHPLRRSEGEPRTGQRRHPAGVG